MIWRRLCQPGKMVTAGRSMWLPDHYNNTHAQVSARRQPYPLCGPLFSRRRPHVTCAPLIASAALPTWHCHLRIHHLPPAVPYCSQVLFYTRMLSDIVGRMVPRKKALAITNPVVLLGLSAGLLVASVAFFVYLQVGGSEGLVRGCMVKTAAAALALTVRPLRDVVCCGHQHSVVCQLGMDTGAACWVYRALPLTGGTRTVPVQVRLHAQATHEEPRPCC